MLGTWRQQSWSSRFLERHQMYGCVLQYSAQGWWLWLCLKEERWVCGTATPASWDPNVSYQGYRKKHQHPVFWSRSKGRWQWDLVGELYPWYTSICSTFLQYFLYFLIISRALLSQTTDLITNGPSFSILNRASSSDFHILVPKWTSITLSILLHLIALPNTMRPN